MKKKKPSKTSTNFFVEMVGEEWWTGIRQNGRRKLYLKMTDYFEALDVCILWHYWIVRNGKEIIQGAMK